MQSLVGTLLSTCGLLSAMFEAVVWSAPLPFLMLSEVVLVSGASRMLFGAMFVSAPSCAMVLRAALLSGGALPAMLQVWRRLEAEEKATWGRRR